MLHSERPEGDRAVGGDQVRASVLDDRPDSSLGDAVQGVDVRRTGGLCDETLIQQLLEVL